MLTSSNFPDLVASVVIIHINSIRKAMHTTTESD